MHSPQRGMAIRRCGLLPNYFGNLSEARVYWTLEPHIATPLLILRHSYVCEVLWSACVSVRLSVCLMSVRSHKSKTALLNFNKFSVHVTRGRGSVLLWRQCNTICTSGFVDDIVFSHNGADGPESPNWPGSGTRCHVCRSRLHLITLATYSKKRNVTVWCPSVRLSVSPVGILYVTQPGAACDAASVHFVNVSGAMVL